jgi:hypothetical protein
MKQKNVKLLKKKIKDKKCEEALATIREYCGDEISDCIDECLRGKRKTLPGPAPTTPRSTASGIPIVSPYVDGSQGESQSGSQFRIPTSSANRIDPSVDGSAAGSSAGSEVESGTESGEESGLELEYSPESGFTSEFSDDEGITPPDAAQNPPVAVSSPLQITPQEAETFNEFYELITSANETAIYAAELNMYYDRFLNNSALSVQPNPEYQQGLPGAEESKEGEFGGGSRKANKSLKHFVARKKPRQKTLKRKIIEVKV